MATTQRSSQLPISHGTLANRLYADFRSTLGTDMIGSILAWTSGGVYPEGASLNGITLPSIAEPTEGQAAAMTMTTHHGTTIDAPQKPIGFRLGSSSRNALNGVHPQLVSVVMQAIAITTQDFTVYEGVRSLKDQKHAVDSGNSKTMKSMHLLQPDGTSHAVDLVPWINGKAKWDWDGCCKVAAAMHAAALKLGVAEHIIWGGAWDRRLSDFGEHENMMLVPAAYARRHVGKDFLDGPHFEWRD